jgi:CIC family chloride channel protein
MAPRGGPDARLAFARYDRAYFQRWLLISALIGVVAGIGAILFTEAIAVTTQWLLGGVVGVAPPSPNGEPALSAGHSLRLWLLPLVTTLGGLGAGLLVFTFAPEAEGHGTDAAIEAFHEKGGRIRPRVPFIKLVASALTIGSGGSAGREGPTAQISAGFGSWLAGVLRLDEHDRRVAEAAGIGAGIGAIFKAPFGGALLSAEILYKRDFETDAIFPSFIASVIGFAIYGAWAGWTPIFGPGNHFEFTHPASLIGYLLLGLSAGLVGLLYPKALYGVRDLFQRIALPNFLKPALGGLLVGLICLVFPQALGMGYGYVQFGIAGDFLHLAAWLMLALVAVKILATALTIGSGGSGGVFGPGMVIGGFLGGALWAGLHTLTPELVTGTNAGAFVVVGMGAFFGGIAKAPLAVILMVAEMTGEYALIAPAMLATMVAYLVSGETSIYESQVTTRLDSPAHRDDHALLLVQTLSVRDALDEQEQEGGRPIVAAPDTPLESLAAWIQDHRLTSIPVIDGGRLVGQVTVKDIARVPWRDAGSVTANEIMSPPRAPMSEDESLYQAWFRMSRRRLRQLVVVDAQDHAKVVGVLTMSAITNLLQPLKTKTLVRKQKRAASQARYAAAVQIGRTTGVNAGEAPDKALAADERSPHP